MSDFEVEGQAEGRAEGGPGDVPAEIAAVTNWAAVNGMVRDRLQQTAEVVSDTLLDPITTAFSVWLVAQYPCIESYASLTGADKIFFDYGLALMIAANVRTWMPKASSTGELINYTHGTTRFAYSRIANQSQQRSKNVIGQTIQTVEHQWLDEAWTMLQLVSCIAAQVAAVKASFHLYEQAGRRRHQQSIGYVALPGGNPLFNLQIDDLTAWMEVWSLR